MVIMIVFAQIVAAVLLVVSSVQATPLDDYVWASDDTFAWTDMGSDHVITGSIGKKSYTGYTLNMTSQRWLTDSDFSDDSQAKSIWWHQLVVIIPDDLRFTRNATLYVTGGNQGSHQPTSTDEDIVLAAALAVNTGCITGTLFQVPNQHITFSADPQQESMSEDAIVAYTWEHFLDDPSRPEWINYFPMVKSALRAMDAMTEYVAQAQPQLNAQLDYYIVTGASKRGWTTWLTGAVGTTAPTQALKERVVAIIPVVLDAINFVAVEHHQYRSYGGWTFALEDYTSRNLTERWDDPNMLTLQEYVDPFFYRDRLTMPKMVVNAGMDEFQQPDDTHYWWADMPEPKHFMMIPNAEHSLITGIFAAVPAMSAFAQALLYKDPVPRFHWEISEQTGQITVTLDNMPNSVVHEATLWWANSCGSNAYDHGTFRRDFRIASIDSPCTCGVSAEGYCLNLKSFWAKETLEATTTTDGRRVYTAQRDAPTDGRWTAFFIDIKFHNKHAHHHETVELSKAKLTAALSGKEDNTVALTASPTLPAQSLKDGKSFDQTKERDRISAGDAMRAYLASTEMSSAATTGLGSSTSTDDDFDFGGFPSDAAGFMEFTSEVSVWPNTFPYEDCYGEDCGTRMV